MELKGSKTAKNLMTAFSAECMAIKHPKRLSDGKCRKKAFSVYPIKNSAPNGVWGSSKVFEDS